MQRSILTVLSLFALACQPPPLPEVTTDTAAETTEDGQPSLSFIFPQSTGKDTVYCPDLIFAVDIDNWEVVPYEDGQQAEEGRGHWHLKDSTGKYLAVATDSWWPVSIGPAEDFPVPTFTVLNAVLANHDHNELNTAVYPLAAATLEIYVGAVEGCIGGGGGTDTGMGY